MTSHRGRCCAACLAVITAACAGPPDGQAAGGDLVIYAAASLRDVVGELTDAFTEAHPVAPVTNFAGSNVLAQQIRAAAGADVFISADAAWVDFLDANARTVAGTRRDMFSNRLVTIARRDSRIVAGAAEDLPRAAFRFLALAEPDAVPAGRYARTTLERHAWGDGDVWSALQDRIAPTLDVRSALALVESDPEIAGIVYRTDAATSDRVRVLFELPPLADQPIVYYATLIADGGSPAAGRLYLDFLATRAARAIAERHGFLVLDS